MTPAGIIAWLTELPARTGLFTDFDGTLAPIVSDPAAAAPVSGVVASLHLLAGRLAAVGVVSGRPARFLADQLALGTAPGPIHAYGLHGLEHTTGAESAEGAEGAEVEVAATAVAWKPVLEAARDEALRDAPIGVAVEDKGLGVTLHWRNAREQLGTAAAGRALGEHLAARHALVARPGRASIELVPPIGIDKGTVLLEWGERLASRAAQPLARLAFFGDDAGDELGFEALESLARSGRVEVLRAAVASPEAPASLLERADVVLAGPSEVAAVLAGAAEALGAQS